MNPPNPATEAAAATPAAPAPQSNFIRDIIVHDLETNKFGGRVQTRFPPEPNGYLHLGHAKAICLNFGLAAEFGGKTNLRFDDTNPEKEEQEYVDSIIRDVRWIGFDWGDRMFYASDYFDQLYAWAVKLIKAGKAYVDDLSPEEIRKTRGTLTESGQNSPFRNRSVEESLDLFERMRKGEFPSGSRTLRAKIDMASPNLNMRDPVMYRILHAEHHRTRNKWCIYPLYDFAHGQSDSLEKVTHSICTLEFEDHRPLYNWFIEQLGIFPSQQIEFDRLNLTYTVLSKRKLLQLVNEGIVRGWDDPRMPTLSGVRRRGYTPEALRNFCNSIGVSKTNGIIELAMLEHFLREDLNKRVPRVMAVLRPLKVVIDNYPEGQVEEMDAINNPEDATDPATRGGNAPDGRKVKSTIHWVSATHALNAEVRVYDNLFLKEDPNEFEEGKDWISNRNPNSLEVIRNAKLEPSLANAGSGSRYQFERLGYFCVDPDSRPDALVFNRTVALKDTWAKVEKRSQR
ncbi:MAG: glutamine--tRNA ligase [Acidobacteria bacterium]|nr:MAG: glutamine--tRNA ligase [Acidobacteriota bacterium]